MRDGAEDPPVTLESLQQALAKATERQCQLTLQLKSKEERLQDVQEALEEK